MAVQTWSPTQKTVNITLSGGDLIATATVPTNDQPVYALNGVTVGKFYWEVVINAGGNCGVGIGNTSTLAQNGNYVGKGTDTMGWYANGSVLNNNAVFATIATYTHVNSLLCQALDLTSATKKWWGRVGAAGNWNNDVIGNQNPATGTGGFTVPAGILAAAVVPGADLVDNTTPDTVIGNFSSNSWVGLAPSGFGPFDPVLVWFAKSQLIQIWDH